MRRSSSWRGLSRVRGSGSGPRGDGSLSSALLFLTRRAEAKNETLQHCFQPPAYTGERLPA